MESKEDRGGSMKEKFGVEERGGCLVVVGIVVEEEGGNEGKVCVGVRLGYGVKVFFSCVG